MRSIKTMSQSVGERVRKIDYDFSKFTIEDFAQWIATQKGINIHLKACSELTLPPGFWFMSDDGAHVMYSSALGPMLETITILHELMHIYLGHKTKYIPMGFPIFEYCSGVSTRDTARQSTEEHDAEMGALMIYQRYIYEAAMATNPISDMFGSEMD
jgi:hypothetical protein